MADKPSDMEVEISDEDDSPVSMEHQVHTAAKHGLVRLLRRLLSPIGESKYFTRSADLAADRKRRVQIRKILAAKTVENGETTTPLIIAARNGHEAVVKILVEYLKDTGDIDQTGTVREMSTEMGTVKVAVECTALWCAVNRGHVKTVVLLLQSGADVNVPTSTGYLPLHTACCFGRVDIVALLIKYHADLTILNLPSTQTYLQLAALHGYADVVKYLLSKNADPHMVDNKGYTALHHAACNGHLMVVTLLVNAGASMDKKNNEGMTPLYLAAVRQHADIVEFFVYHQACSIRDRIATLELLGAAYAKNDINMCFCYLVLAMNERVRSSSEKNVLTPVEAYEYRLECTNLEELINIKDDHHALRMEALMVFERVLGEEYWDTCNDIMYYGCCLVEEYRFDSAISLLKRAIHLKQKNDRLIDGELWNCVILFCLMLCAGEPVKVTYVMDILEFCVEEMQRDQERLKVPHMNIESVQHSYDTTIHSALFLLAIIIKIQKRDAEEARLFSPVKHLNDLKLSLFSMPGYTPLHVVCSYPVYAMFDNLDDNRYHEVVQDVTQFPNGSVLELLLKCRADPNQIDEAGNTPLHIIVRHNNPNDLTTQHQIITQLIKFGAHIDHANNNRDIVSDEVTTILGTSRHINLQCLAARVVHEHNIPYIGQVPQNLYECIERH